MQVPEKLSLIGGSILLASTLVFTLKSQASNILPKVDSGMSSLVNADKSGQSSSNSSQSQQPSQPDQQKQQQAQEEQAFNSNFQQAQQKGWQTGMWGSSKYYIDDDNNFHVGSGQLNGPIKDAIGDSKFEVINSINLDGPIQAPQDSTDLFGNGSGYDNASNINGLERLDTSQTTDMNKMFAWMRNINSLDLSHFDTSHVTNMEDMFESNDSLSSLDLSHFDTHNVTNMANLFASDNSLSNLDLSHFDTHNVTNMANMFASDNSLSNLDLSHFDTHNVTNMSYMFDDDSSLSNLDLSNFDTSNVTNMANMFEGDNIHQLSLGSNTKLQDNTSNDNYYSNLSGDYQSNGQAPNLANGSSHPGTWINQ